MMPNIGESRWSEFFGNYIVLTKYIDDNNWFFKIKGGFREFKAQTAWSKMKITP